MALVDRQSSTLRSLALAAATFLFVFIATATHVAALDVITVPTRGDSPNGTPQAVPHAAYNGHATRFKAIARGCNLPCTYGWDFDGDGVFDDQPPTPPRQCVPDALGWTCYDLSESFQLPTVAIDSFFDVQIRVTCGPDEAYASYPVLVRADVPPQVDPGDNATSLPQLATEEQRRVMAEVAVDDALWRLHLQMAARSGADAEIAGTFSGPEPDATAASFLWLAFLNGHLPAYPPGTYPGPEPYAGWLGDNDARWLGDPYAETALRSFNSLVGSLAPVPVPPEDEEDDGAPPIPGTNDGLGLAGPSLDPFQVGELLGGLALSGLDGTTVQTGDPTHVRGMPLEAIVQQIVDALVMLQIDDPSDDDGGWGYATTHDASTAQWAYIGLEAARAAMENAGVHVPQRSRARMASVLLHNQDPLTGLARPTNGTCTDTGGYGITGGALLGAASLGWDRLEPQHDGSVLDLDWAGTPITAGDARLSFERYLQGLADRYETFQLDCTGEVSGLWDNDGGTNPEPYLRTDHRGNIYSLYSTQKGARTLHPEPTWLLGTHDWFREYSVYLVRSQDGDGSWLDEPWSGGAIPRGIALGRELSTAWAALILTPSIFEPAPVAVACVDDDGDWYCAGGLTPDCDDTDPDMFPGNREVCDGKDNDCDGFTDEFLLTDADGDGVSRPGSCGGGADDCNDADPDAWSRPGEVTGLRLERLPGLGIRLDWDAPVEPGGALWVYDVLVGPVPPDFLAPATYCLETNDLDQQALDPDDPPSGELHAYLVSAANGCGRGTLGYRTSGEERDGIECVALPPLASLGASPNPAGCGQTVLFDGAGSHHPDPRRSIVRYDWDFGDGTTLDDGGPAATHAYDEFGDYPARLTVTDDNVPPLTDTADVVVDVSLGNVPPVADPDGPYDMELGEPLQLDGSGSVDANAPCDEIVSYEWDVDVDGVYDFTSTGPTFLVPWGELSGLQPWPTDPLTGFPQQTIRLRVTDSLGLTDTDTTSLRVYVNSPVAVVSADPNPAACGQTVELDGSDSYHGFPPRSIVRYDWDFGDGTTLDDGGPLAPHAYGSADTYDVVLTVTDDNDPPRTDTASVGVVVHCEPPVVDAGPDRFVVEGGILVVDAGFSDPDPGETHTAVVEWGDGTPPEPAPVDEGPGTVTASHVYADNATYPVVVTVTDSNGLEGSDGLAVDVSNVAPVVSVAPVAPIFEGERLYLDSGFDDPGTLDSHTASVDWGDGTFTDPAPVTESPFGPPGDPGGMSGTVEADHVYAGSGPFTARCCVTDDDGDFACDEVVITVE